MSSSKELLQQPVGRKPAAPPDNGHYDAARRGWNDRLENEMRHARGWRLATAGAGVVTLAAVIGLVLLANRPAPAPLYVQVNPDGSMQAMGRASSEFVAGEREYRYYLGKWVERVRTVSLDPVVVRNNWNEAYAFMTPQAANKLNAWARQPDSPMAKVGRETVSVQVTAVLPISPTSYQARWIETSYSDQGQVKDRAGWTATFTVKQERNVPTALELTNPGGIFITDFNWQRDLGGVAGSGP